MTKKCSRCKTEKSLEDFGKCSRSRDGYNKWCKNCSNEYAKIRRANSKPRTIVAKPDHKKCYRCEIEKPISEFYKDNKYSLDGHVNYCKTCHRQYYREGERNRKSQLKHDFGISWEEYNAKLLEQDSRCAICGRQLAKESRTLTPTVDHDHKTGKFRGLLCGECNKGIGLFRDNPDIIKKAIGYLEKENANLRIV